MKKISKPSFGIFTKLALIFSLGGILPLLIVGRFFFVEFTNNIENILINDAGTVLNSTSGYVDTMLKEWKDKTVALYTQEVDGGMYLGDVLLDGTISQEEKNILMRRYLLAFGPENGLKSVRFLDKDGNLYYVSEVVGKIINSPVMEQWKKEEAAADTTEKGIMLSPVHDDKYFSNINDEVITVKRNLYDVTSLKTVDNYLGSIYLDISKDVIEQQLSDINMGSRSGFYIIDWDGKEIYRNKNQAPMTAERIKELLKAIKEGSNSYLEDEDSYYLYQENLDGGWISLVRIHKGDILENIKMTERYIMTILLVSSIILLSLYLLFSVRISIPIRKLKAGMEQIQKGDLDTRVHIQSKDEIGVLADGLNQMAGQLNEYIERVYGAEIKQKEAELGALKSQIKPHYLYNTLDVIRMTAITNDDRQTADMVESLARQLRYITGYENDVVLLERELVNISDYFKLISVRFEDLMELKISVPEKLKKAPILKLILQPIVENAVKYGLKPKKGKGMVWVSAKRADNMLEVTVMDDGVGMTEERLKLLRCNLTMGYPNKRAEQEAGGIGLFNVKERIEKNFGKDYGIEVQSSIGTGTIVILRVPYTEETGYAEGDFNR